MPQYDRKTLHNPSKAEVAKHHFNKLFDELNDLDARYLTGYVERKPYLALGID